MNNGDNLDDFFLPEQINEQIDYLASIQDAGQQATLPGAPTIAALQSIYKDDEAILQRAWIRIASIEASSQTPWETTTIVHMHHDHGANTMQESYFFTGMEGTVSSTPDLLHPARPPRHMRRVWSGIGLVAAIAIVLVNVLAWGLLTHIFQGASASKTPDNKTSTTVPVGKQLCSYSKFAQGLDVSWSLQGKIALSSTNGVNIINASTCTSLLTYHQPQKQAPHEVLALRGLNASWSPDGQRLVIAGSGASILDAATGNVLLNYYPGNNMLAGSGEIHNTEVYTSSWSPDGKYIASVVDTDVYHLHPEGESVQIWDASSGKLIRTLGTGLQNGVYGEQITWSPDGTYVAVGEARAITNPLAPEDPIHADSVYVWNASSGELMLHFNPLTINPGHVKIDTNLPPNERIAWSPDSKSLATASQDVVQGWNIPTGRNLFTFNAQRSVPGLPALVWSPSGTYLAMAGYLNVRLWNVHTRQPGYTYSTGNNTLVTGIAWSPNSTLLATMTENTTDHNANATLTIWGAP